MASSSNSSCAACKFLRRKCTLECVFMPFFPPAQPQKFANVHKIFGARNVTNLLNEMHPHQREDAVNSLAYKADARVKDSAYDRVGAISMGLAETWRNQIFMDQNIMEPHISMHHMLRTNYEQAEIESISGPYDPNYVSLAIAEGTYLGVGIAASPSREEQEDPLSI